MRIAADMRGKCPCRIGLPRLQLDRLIWARLTIAATRLHGELRPLSREAHTVA
jgi:hypothetical protein